MHTTVSRLLALSALLLSVFSLPSAAQKNGRAEADAALVDILQGRRVSAATSRLKYLGMGSHACEALSRYARSDDVRQRRDVADALSELATPTCEPTLRTMATDPETSIRVASARGLGRLARTSPALWLLLSDKASGVRREAAKSLGLAHSKDSGPRLLDAADAEGEPEVREAMIISAAAVPNPKVVPRLEKFLKQSSESTRLAAARALCLQGAPSGLAVAKAKLQGATRYERRDGVQLLDGAPLKASGPLLRPLLEARPLEPSVAAPAARVLHQAGEKKVVEWLVLQSYDADAEARRSYEEALEALKVTDEERKAILRSRLLE
jgi:HEAT repeat protein